MQVNPVVELSLWLDNESEAGAPNSSHAVLSSTSTNGCAHGRVIAIREITEDGILFFTQKNTRKVE
ncbi:MAG: hypothetical protein ACRCXC_00215 [Legionella sp.]